MARFGVLDPLFFPPPSDIARVGAAMAVNGELAKALGSTLRNMLLGYIAGCSTGLACGLVISRRSTRPPNSACFRCCCCC